MGESIGFVGLGEMGLPMAKNLMKAGYSLCVCDTNPTPVRQLEYLGAHTCGSPSELASHTGVFMVNVRTSQQVEQVISGRNGLLSGAAAGSIILIMSTVDPDTVRHMHQTAARQQVDVLDCPVSGGKHGAEAGTLTFMAAGSESVFERCKPWLKAMGQNLFYLGDVGMGQTAKLCNNLLLLVHMCAAHEAMALAENAGVKTDVLRELVSVSSGNSWVIENWETVKGWKSNYAPGGTLDVVFKDIKATLSLAERLREPLHLSALASQLVRF